MNVPASEHLQEGDMKLPPARAGHKLNKWPKGIVVYKFDPSIGRYRNSYKNLMKETLTNK